MAEPASGPTQFGQGVDDWVTGSCTQNTVHIRQVVLPMHYLIKAPTLDVGAEAQDISRSRRPSAQMFPLSKPPAWRCRAQPCPAGTLLNEQHQDQKGGGQKGLLAPSGYFTAADRGTVYDGDVFPNSIGATSSLPTCLETWCFATFTGAGWSQLHRAIAASKAKEFLASTDMWSGLPTSFRDRTAIYTSPTCYRETIDQTGVHSGRTQEEHLHFLVRVGQGAHSHRISPGASVAPSAN